MPSRHRIDTETRYDRSVRLPKKRKIEDPVHEPVPAEDPPMVEVEQEVYLASPDLEEAVNLAIALGRPLLLQGDPGSGKTRLAYAVAFSLGLPVEEAYIKSTSRAQDLLYVYDAVSRLYDAQLPPPSAGDETGSARAADVARYVRLGPLGRAIARAQYGRRSVVLIDEIDKADLDFPNDLLRELDQLEFQVQDAPDMAYRVPDDRPDLRPIIFVTHNEEKALPAPFLRRCVYHYVEFPRDARLLGRILSLHQITDQNLKAEAITILLRLRELDLAKRPGLSELLDWAGYLQATGESPDELRSLPYVGALLKQRSDQDRAREALKA
jgi:MoxR-like ATPase